MNICFTGHRPPRLSPKGTYEECREFAQVRNWLGDTVSQIDSLLAVDYWIWGGALGVDQWAAEQCQGLGLETWAYLAFPGMEKRWPKESFDYFARLIKGCKGNVSVLSDSFSNTAYWVRDKAMVDNSGLVIAVLDEEPDGGTYATFCYALSQGKPIIRFNPSTRETEYYVEGNRIEGTNDRDFCLIDFFIEAAMMPIVADLPRWKPKPEKKAEKKVFSVSIKF